MARPDQPRLPDRYPDVAATWYDLGNKYMASEYAPTSPDVVWWRCNQGHEWLQRIASRTELPAWKQGDIAACRECLGHGYWGQFACGHDRWFRDARARERARFELCRSCQQDAAIEERNTILLEQAGVTALLEALAQGSTNHPALQGIVLDPEATPLLIDNWRWSAQKRLKALRRRHEHLTLTMAQEAIDEVRNRARYLTPTREEVDEAVATNNLLRIPLLSEHVWVGGWLWHQQCASQPAPHLGEESDVATRIAEAINAWASQVTQEPRPLVTSEFTNQLTHEIAQALLRHDPSGRVHREALIPIIEPGAVSSGAVDLVLCRIVGPDIVIELDSQPKSWSATKLAYARQAEAITIWVRFGEGPVSPLRDGTLVVDARRTTTALSRGRVPAEPGTHVVDAGGNEQMSLLSV